MNEFFPNMIEDNKLVSKCAPMWRRTLVFYGGFSVGGLWVLQDKWGLDWSLLSFPRSSRMKLFQKVFLNCLSYVFFCYFLLKTLNPLSLSKLKPFCDYVHMPNWECITSQTIGRCLVPHLRDKVLILSGLKNHITSNDFPNNQYPCICHLYWCKNAYSKILVRWPKRLNRKQAKIH